MSEGRLRKAEKKGFNFTVFETKAAKPSVWLCMSPNFVSVAKSPCGLGASQEEAFDDCIEHMKEKKINSAAIPKKAKK